MAARVPSPLVVCLLGRFRVLKEGAPVAIRAGGKTEALLSNLALREHYGASREWLLDVMWPDSDGPHALSALNSLVHSIRKLLGDVLGGAAPVTYDSGTYQLNVAAGVTVDVADFDILVTRAEHGFRTGDITAAVTYALRAIALYQGDLCLVDAARDLVERERLRALHLSLLGHVADHYFRQADYPTALRYALCLLSNDSCREDAYRLVMRCHVRLGERAQAFRQYRTCERVLAAEFGVRPEAMTAELFHLVRTSPETI